jgi:crotonobetainyl-CoA:carnitine CoA-transferase CaiB-like acyl-CoA transferase
MAESTLMANDLASIELSGVEPEVGFRAGQNWSPVFQLASGRHVSITLDCATDGGYAVWCAAFPQAEWVADPRFATSEGRVAQRAALEAGIGRWVARLDSPEALVAAIGRTDLMVADVRTVPELAASDWAAERGAFVVVPVGGGEEVVVPQAPWRFSHADSGVVPTVGFRGEHNREVLRDLLGLTDERVDALTADGVLSDRVPGWRRNT